MTSDSHEVETMAREICKKLRQLGRGPRQGHRPSAQFDFGVYTNDLRSVVRAFKSRLRAEEGNYVYKLALELLTFNNTECRQVAYELIAGHRGASESLTARRIEALGAGIDNWACVDGFCCTLVGQAWRTGRISDGTIRRWSRSEDQWWRRAAAVATVPLNLKSRGGSGDTERTLMVCQDLISDDSVMVQKAISWALRALVSWDRNAVERFLSNNESDLSARVKREVRHKLATGRKN